MSANKLSFSISNSEELGRLLKKAEQDLGHQDTSRILVNSVRLSLFPAFNQMKESVAPFLTGELRRSLSVTARRPTSKDLNSRYVSDSDTVIGAITTAPGNKIFARRVAENKRTARKLGKQYTDSDYRNDSRIRFGARAIVTQFGSKKGDPAQQWMTKAFEANKENAVNVLFSKLKERLEGSK